MKTKQQTTIAIRKINESIEVTNNYGLSLKFPLEGSRILVSTAISYSVVSQLRNKKLLGRNYKLTLTIEEL